MRMFLCGTWRIMFITAYLMLIPLAPDVADMARVPVAVVTLLVFVYDERDRRRRPL